MSNWEVDYCSRYRQEVGEVFSDAIDIVHAKEILEKKHKKYLEELSIFYQKIAWNEAQAHQDALEINLANFLVDIKCLYLIKFTEINPH